MKKLTVTIGIPAYNEQDNIGILLKEIFLQTQRNIIIKEIIVSSDASTDNTNSLVKGFKHVKLLVHKKRKGLAAMQNAIIKESTGDYLVLVNADIKFDNKNLIDKLCTYSSKNSIDLCSIHFKELFAKTTFAKMLYMSMKLKTSLFENYKNGNNVFTCHGQLRCLSRKFYSNLSFPISVGEDAFSYFYCITNNYTYGYNKNISAYYKLPETIQDHQKQSIRFHQSQILLRNYFRSDVIKREYTLPTFLLIKQLAYTFIKSPLFVIGYVFMTLYMKRISSSIENVSNTWTTAASSKLLTYEK